MKVKFDWDAANRHKLYVVNGHRDITEANVESVFQDTLAFIKPNRTQMKSDGKL